MNGSAASKLHPRHPALTTLELFRLWRAAIKDDDRITNFVIQTVYEDVMAFDCERAQVVMELIVRREPTARNAFHALLEEARAWHTRAAMAPAALAAASAAHFEPNADEQRPMSRRPAEPAGSKEPASANGDAGGLQ